MKLQLLETWSRRHTAPCPWELPKDYVLATHQWAVYEALQDPAVDVVFNVAMTGDGKSLAAYLPLLRAPKGSSARGLYAYPTNELIRDQERQLTGLQADFQRKLRHSRVDGDALSDYQRQAEASRYIAIQDLLHGTDCVLTNPDIFTLILNFHYVPRGGNPATLAQKLANWFSFYVFDEFHIYDAHQVGTILDAMLFLKAQRQGSPLKFVFLSATPSRILLRHLQAAGLRHVTIAGDYRHGPRPGGEFRSILAPVALELVPLDRGTLEWFRTNVGLIRDFFARNPVARGLVVVNSVFTAMQLTDYLRTALPELRVASNTGLTGSEERRQADTADLIIATSTVDVGVDFRINLLIFESLDAGSFIQRLGRLGRHRHCPQGTFAEYQAIALLPGYLVQRFQLHFADGQNVARTELYNAVKGEQGEGIFPQPNRFDGYLPRWSVLNSMWRAHQLQQDHTRYGSVGAAYQRLAAGVFAYTGAARDRARALKQAPYQAVAHALCAFRGGGQPDVWVHTPEARGVTHYSLFRLLAGTEFSFLTEAEAERICRRVDSPFYKPLLELYARIESFREERLPYQVRFQGRLTDAGLEQAVDRRGFYLEARRPEMLRINDCLLAAPLATTATRDSTDVLRRRLALPPLFALYPVVDESGATFSVAFGQDALLLDSLLYRRAASTHGGDCR